MKKLMRFFTDKRDVCIYQREIDGNIIIPRQKDIVDLTDILGNYRNGNVYEVEKICFDFSDTIEFIDIFIRRSYYFEEDDI